MKIDWLKEVVSSSLRDVCKQRPDAQGRACRRDHLVVDDKGTKGSERCLPVIPCRGSLGSGGCAGFLFQPWNFGFDFD